MAAEICGTSIEEIKDILKIRLSKKDIPTALMCQMPQ